MRRRIALLTTVAALAVTGCGYNTIQTYDEQVNTAKGQIEVQLQRRADLIPNLVSTVKGYAKQEQTIFTDVARAQAVLTGALARPGGTDPEELANANAGLTRALTPFFTFAQAYPQLKSDQQFLRLQDELTGTENRIGVARQDYNSAVQQYNTYIRKFPAALTAKATGAQPRKYFEVTDAGARTVPKVDMSDVGQPTPPAGATTSTAPRPTP
ncbi:MAG TPA: LemA family protein [Gemmatimonadaceae bacterium]|nr:LemA family protein [Gemmatimonadaceae bacterium]